MPDRPDHKAGRRARRPLRQGTLKNTLPRLGAPGSRSAELHSVSQEPGPYSELSARERVLLSTLRLVGTTGALLIGVGGLGAGALPVVENPYSQAPLGSLMSRMLHTSTVVVFVGVALLVVAWVWMGFLAGAANQPRIASRAAIKTTFISWALPIALTAPLFTQDIYSYLAQGSIVAQGLDPYSAGPAQLLAPDDPLVRSVPFIWAQSPSPYGPVALGLASFISTATNNSIVLGVYAHRAVSLLGLIVASWALSRLARRCHVAPTTALWLGILNPLTLLHLVGGIHNEAILLGFLLAGTELSLRGLESLELKERCGWINVILGSALIACAGLVKVTGFIGLGFVGMALARHMHLRGHPAWRAITVAALAQILVLLATVAFVSLLTGIGLGWVTGQGGAASIRSWLSPTTSLGVITGFIGMLLDLGDHTTAILSITRTLGLIVAVLFIIRMLFATFAGRIHPVGGLGVATFVLVILFPVVHPWYLLWAILPLAAWANRFFFRAGVVIYSTLMSFFVLPRGLALPPETIFQIYAATIISAGAVLALGWFFLRKIRWLA